MNDLVGLGHASKALLDHIASAIGTLYRPRAIRLEGKASADVKAYELMRSTEGYLASMKLLEASEEDILHRAASRVRSLELQRQLNIEAVIDEAVRRIEGRSDKGEPSKVEPDWMAKYLDYAKEVSDEEVRGIWAEILARKSVENRRSVSLLTLDSLRLIERHQASIFLQICKRVATFRTCFPFVLDEFGEGDLRSVDALHALQELGLITIRNLRSQYDVEYLSFPLPGFRLQLSEDAETELDAFEGEASAIITEAGLTFRGVELARVILDEELLPFYENFQTPALKDPYHFMTLEEQTSTLKEWFSLLSEKGGYKVEIIVRDSDGVECILLWEEGGLVSSRGKVALATVPATLRQLMRK